MSQEALYNSSMRWLMAAVAGAGLLTACSSRAVHPKTWPFSPEVEEFIEIYVNAGGDKLTKWVQAPERVTERLRATVGRWWAEGPRTDALLHLAARLGHPEAENALAAAGDRSGGAGRAPTAGMVTAERAGMRF